MSLSEAYNSFEKVVSQNWPHVSDLAAKLLTDRVVVIMGPLVLDTNGIATQASGEAFTRNAMVPMTQCEAEGSQPNPVRPHCTRYQPSSWR